MKIWPALAVATVALGLVACQSIRPPKGVPPVTGFDASRYLGQWYEVARLDNRFEKGLDHVTATYQQRNDGGIRVINRGFNPRTGKWSQSEGKAYFTGDRTTAALKVSFFGPFYAGYNVISMHGDYQYALVCGPDRKYLWILSRTPQMPSLVKEIFISQARQLGFRTDQLLWVKQ